MDKYLFVTIGAPACGKSMFYHKLTQDKDWNFMGVQPAYVSSDEIREKLYGSEDCQDDPAQVFMVMRHTAEKYLSEGRSVYLDATHAKKEWRKYVIRTAKRHGAAVVALYFDIPLWTLLQRDKHRKRHVGPKVTLKYFYGIEAPTKEEGFDTVLVVDKDGEYTEKR